MLGQLPGHGRAGRRPGVAVPTRPEEDFILDPADLEAAIGPKCKAVILNSPSNPTGAVASPERVDALVKVALDKGCVVISDEIYGGLIYGDAKHRCALQVDHPGVKDGVVVVDGVSKVYAMTGWRIGYAVGPEALIKAAAKIQSQSTSGACGIAQAAAVGALEKAGSDAVNMLVKFARRREVARTALGSIPGVTVPGGQGAFYLFPDFSAYLGSTLEGRQITDSLVLSEVLLERALVAAVPGQAFGMDGYLRFSYALGEEDIMNGIARVRDTLAKATPQPQAAATA